MNRSFFTNLFLDFIPFTQNSIPFPILTTCSQVTVNYRLPLHLAPSWFTECWERWQQDSKKKESGAKDTEKKREEAEEGEQRTKNQEDDKDKQEDAVSKGKEGRNDAKDHRAKGVMGKVAEEEKER